MAITPSSIESSGAPPTRSATMPPAGRDRLPTPATSAVRSPAVTGVTWYWSRSISGRKLPRPT